MFRLYSSRTGLKTEVDTENDMSELQERLQKFGARLAGLLGRLAVIVHNDIIRLGKIAGRNLILLYHYLRKSSRRIRLPGSFARLGRPEDFPSDTVTGYTPGKASTPEAVFSLNDKQRVTSLPDGQCVYAIGDIHGRCDLLVKLLDKIDADTAGLPSGTKVILVFLGDYIDRGMQSRQVIDLLMGERLKNYQTVFLMGNHEEALLRFRDEASFGVEWARYGGAETLFSYGLKPPIGRALHSSEAWQSVWEQFRETFPASHLEFYQSMKHYITIGDYFFVHAGLRPDVPIEEQTVKDMLWIRDEFLDDGAIFPYLVVHGHTTSQQPFLDNRRMGLDTSAFSSGILTAGKFAGTDIEIIST